MKDIDGVELKIGQRVAVATNTRTSVDFKVGKVVGFTPQNVVVELLRKYNYSGEPETMRKSPYLVAVLPKQEAA